MSGGRSLAYAGYLPRVYLPLVWSGCRSSSYMSSYPPSGVLPSPPRWGPRGEPAGPAFRLLEERAASAAVHLGGGWALPLVSHRWDLAPPSWVSVEHSGYIPGVPRLTQFADPCRAG